MEKMHQSTSEMRPAAKKRKLCGYNPEWKMAYMCRFLNGDLQCLICKKCINCNFSHIKRHYELHRSEYNKYQGEERSRVYLALKRNEELSSEMDDEDDIEGAKQASYEIALKLVRGNYAFSDGEMVKSCILKAVSILSPSQLPKYEAIRLSSTTIASRVDEMADNMEFYLEERIRSFTAISLAFDESTDAAKIPHIAIFMRGVDAELNIFEDLLDIIPMKGITQGEDIFQSVDACVKRLGLSWHKVVCIATDSANPMTGLKSGLIAKIRQKLVDEKICNNFIAIHCLFYIDELYAKFSSLNNVLPFVVKCINFLRANALRHPVFKDFLESAASEGIDNPYYSKLRWLCRGTTLKRFFELRDAVHVVLAEKGKHISEMPYLEWGADLAFITDLTQHINVLNTSLLGRKKLISDMYAVIKAFKKKLLFWKKQLTENKFTHFPCLESLADSQEINTKKYVEELSILEKEFQERFADMFAIKSKLDIFSDPYSFDFYEAPNDFQLDLIDLQCDSLLKYFYRESSLIDFYKRATNDNLPNFRQFVSEMLAMFGSTYSCEEFFSSMKFNRFPEGNFKNVMRLAATKGITPNIEELI